ncbi:hypothetical protein, partial [Brenneria salicis]|uniref:hypothetical protein n=1 Tax=Brenneria salicis TaxID=55214 RepID=UPI001B8785F2
GFEFLFVHNLPVSATGVNISKTGNYTILITVSIKTNNTLSLSTMRQQKTSLHSRPKSLGLV